MAGVPIKFRCFRCNQLLGVSRSKAGAVVACPKCSAELIVPEPTEPEPEAAPTPAPLPVGPPSVDENAPAPASASPPEPREPALDAGIPLEFLDIRPEDIRVEPGIAFVPEPLAAAPAPAPDVPAEPPAPFVPVEEPPPSAESVEPTAPKPPEPPPAPPSPAPPSRPPEPSGVDVVQALRIDAPRVESTIRRAEPSPTRSRDLILPRSVVAAWSLLVILALGFAFIAGLLAGHFVWRVH